MDEQSLGRHLQVARRTAGMTQQELCQRADISYSTLAKIERGAIKAPSVFTIQRVSEVLGLSLDQMMGGSKSANRIKGRSESGVTFVYFDINGCLVRFFHRAFTTIAHDSGAASDTIETAFWHYNDAVCRGDMSLDEFNTVLAKLLKMPHFNWTDYYLDSVDPIKEMHQLAAWAASHYNIGLLSNIMPGQIDSMIKAGLLPRLPYASIIDSSEVKAIKPEKQIYEIAQAKAGVPAEEILLIDDSRANLMAAERSGWKVLWFDDFRPEESAVRVKSALVLATNTPSIKIPV